MKRFQDILSPVSWSFLFVGFLPMFLVVFRPSLRELAMFLVVDYAALLGIRWLDRRLFLLLYPDSTPFFPEEAHSLLERNTPTQNGLVLESMMRFPGRRALYCAVTSFVKAAPATLVVVLYWKHEASNFLQFAKLFAAQCVMYPYFYGAVFIESHILVSKKIAVLHKQYRWNEAFRAARIPFKRREFEMEEFISMLAICIFVVSLQWLLTSTASSPEARAGLATEVTVVGVAGFLLVARIWYLGRQYFIGALEHLFVTLGEFDFDKKEESLPLHSSAVLARFEQAFNSLNDRLRGYERELSRWIFFQTEESRYRALGEISALIVHDLSGPLHVIKFCAEELKQKPLLLTDSRYLEQLVVNGKKSLDLIDSLKAYLKDSKTTERGVIYQEAHEHVVRLLCTQFDTRGLAPVDFRVTDEAAAQRLAMTKADFIHVLLNIFRNSFDNFLEHRNPKPQIRVEITSMLEKQVTLGIRDNGTGLSAERFERLTAMTALPASADFRREGLGLRLVCRLVERNEGSLLIKQLPQGEPGTQFHLTLKLL